MFSHYVADQLKYYVYRLIDPRNGETFYIGKGQGNRVFDHVRGELAVEDAISEKLLRIREIRLAGFEVGHVIHRHGLDEEKAFEVESALIDAYPGMTNQIGGRWSDERGLMHANQIVERYEAKEAVFAHKAILININQTAVTSENIYSAVRYAWRLDPAKAKQAEIVLAVQRGLIVGGFIADEWLPATTENFPALEADVPGRWGFIGRKVPDEIAQQYHRRRVPDAMRKKGMANPIRYAF